MSRATSHRARQARYQRKPEVQERRREAQRRWAAANQEKIAAHRLLRSAVRRGLVVRPERCEACGTTEARIEAAHYDYVRPLEVRWLCPPCHHGWDRERRG